MPFGKEKRGEKWVVTNTDTGDVKGEHSTESDADGQLAAMYANDADADKAIEAGDWPGVNLVGHGKDTDESIPSSETLLKPGEPSLSPGQEDEEEVRTPMLKTFSFFMPLTKVEEVTHRIWAIAAKEEPDVNHEILDYETSDPEFRRWSQDQYKRSGGKSYGNVRSMHQLTSAGRVAEFRSNPRQKQWDVCIEVVDPVEWDKVLKGVYTGISVGGSYKRRWPDSEHFGYTRYTADPVELSMVDVPCIPSALITLVKADGRVVQLPLGKDKTMAGDSMQTEKADLQKQLPSSPAATGGVAGIPDMQVQRMADPSTLLEISSTTVPTGDTLESRHASAKPISDVASMVTQATPPQGVRKVTNPNPKLQKQDTGSALDAARTQVGTLLSQAKAGEIDMDALAQLAATLDVSLDEASDNSANSGGATGTPQSTDEVIKSTESDQFSLPTHTDDSGHSTDSASSGSESTPSYSSDEDDHKPSDSIPRSKVSKGVTVTNQPLSTTPPMPTLILHGGEDDDDARELPEFMDHMMRGHLGKAQQLVGKDQRRFDSLVMKSAMAIMNQYGVNYRNLNKIHAGAGDVLDLQKAIVASDLPGVWLMKLAKLMLPLYAGVRRRLPTQSPQGMSSNQATWRAMLGFSNVVFGNMMSVAEAAIGDVMNESFLTFNAAYRDIAQNDSVTLKAIAASRGFDDPMQVAVIRTLTAFLQGEERKIIGDNYAAIGAMTAVTAAPGSGGAIASDTYLVKVSALTYRGLLLNSKNGGPGETAVATSGSVVISGSSTGMTIAASWPSKPGAWAYNVYIENSAHAAFYVKTVKVPLFSTAVTAATSASPLGWADNSANAYGFEGLGQWSMLSNIYSQTINNKVGPYDLLGAGITADDGGIPEFDTVLEELWNTWQIAPTIMYVSSKGINKITGKLLSLNNAALYRIEISEERGTIRGGAFVTGYVNKYAAFADGTPRYIDILPHPYVPDGTCLINCESINYPMAREARGFALDILVPYTYFPLAQNTIQYPFAITCSETLECFHPAVQVAIQGIDWTK
jgi:hypothetical protein